MKKFLINFFVYLLCIFIISQIQLFFFEPIFSAEHLIFPYAVHPFDICTVYPNTWNTIKTAYFITFIFSYTILHFNISSFIQNKFFKVKSKNLKESKSFKKVKNQITSDFSISKLNSKKFKKDSNLKENTDLNLLVGLNENNDPVYISEKRIISKHINNRNNWKRKNFICHVPFFKTINKI